MGPIEAELRNLSLFWLKNEFMLAHRASYTAWRLIVGACRSLGFHGSTLLAQRGPDGQGPDCLPDVMSEAIEAAGALGL